MSRQTHDMALDHHGTAVAEEIATGTATSGYVPVSTGVGAAPAWTAPSGGGGGPTDLVTGDSSTFVASVGSWANTGGTQTFSTASSTMWGGGSGGSWGSLKLVTSASGQYTELPVSGTFTAGKTYTAAIAVMVEENLSYDFNALLGVIGTDATTLSIVSTNPGELANNGNYGVFIVRWTPGATVTSGVKIRVSRTASTGTLTYHVGRAQLIEESPGAGVLGTFMEMGRANVSTTPASGVGLSVQTTGGAVRITAGGSFNGGFQIGVNGTAEMKTPSGNGGVYAGDAISGAYAGGAATGSLSGQGYNIEVGPDYVGLNISEKDASTIQVYDDAGGSYDIELVDQGTFHFKMVNSGGVAAIPSRGMLPQYSAAPGSPAEGWSYYNLTTHKAYTWDGTTWQAWW